MIADPEQTSNGMQPSSSSLASVSCSQIADPEQTSNGMQLVELSRKAKKEFDFVGDERVREALKRLEYPE